MRSPTDADAAAPLAELHNAGPLGQENHGLVEGDVPVQVIVHSTMLSPPLFVECSGRKITIGRSPSSQVRLPDPTVSQNHAVLRQRGKDYVITDEHSTNGTALLSLEREPAVWLSPGSARVVAPGARLLLGQVELELRMDSSAEGSASQDLARDLVTAGLASLELELTEDGIDSALLELTRAEDEPVGKQAEPEPPPEPRDDGGVSEEAERSVADWAIAGLATCILLASAACLYWLLRPSG